MREYVFFEKNRPYFDEIIGIDGCSDCNILIKAFKDYFAGHDIPNTPVNIKKYIRQSLSSFGRTIVRHDDKFEHGSFTKAITCAEAQKLEEDSYYKLVGKKLGSVPRIESIPVTPPKIEPKPAPPKVVPIPVKVEPKPAPVPIKVEPKLVPQPVKVEPKPAPVPIKVEPKPAPPKLVPPPIKVVPKPHEASKPTGYDKFITLHQGVVSSAKKEQRDNFEKIVEHIDKVANVILYMVAESEPISPGYAGIRAYLTKQRRAKNKLFVDLNEMGVPETTMASYVSKMYDLYKS